MTADPTVVAIFLGKVWLPKSRIRRSRQVVSTRLAALPGKDNRRKENQGVEGICQGVTADPELLQRGARWAQEGAKRCGARAW